MSDIIKYISKVEIKGLWGRYDISWDLHEDVNILSGINGSGKTTILNSVSKLLANFSELDWNNNPLIDEIGEHINMCKIVFNNASDISFGFINKRFSIKSEIEKGTSFEQEIYNKYFFLGEKYNAYIYEKKELSDRDDFVQIDLISTFDAELKSSEALAKLSVDTVKTELDWEIYQLQKKYLEYQLNIGKRAFETINRNGSNADVAKIQANQNRFLDIIDSLFEPTGKKINRKENEVSILIGEKKLSPYQLSSGEKQILVILLAVLVQDNKNAILFMDEPEISLHFDWQNKLIQYIRELNPNVQIILATHSPAIIMDGWMDKVANVSDLIKSEHKVGNNETK